MTLPADTVTPQSVRECLERLSRSPGMDRELRARDAITLLLRCLAETTAELADSRKSCALWKDLALQNLAGADRPHG